MKVLERPLMGFVEVPLQLMVARLLLQFLEVSPRLLSPLHLTDVSYALFFQHQQLHFHWATSLELQPLWTALKASTSIGGWCLVAAINLIIV